MSDKRFFRITDGGADWSVVAIDREHAVSIMRDMGATWEADTDVGCVDVGIDVAINHQLVDVTEMSLEDVERQLRCHTEDDRGVIPLAQARIGDAFCSEW